MADLVTTYGAILNDSSASSRATNKTAFLTAFSTDKNVYIAEQGTLYLPTNAAIEIPGGVTFSGAGMFGGTIISGDGNIFTISTTGGAESRVIRDFQIQNENSATGGILFGVNLTTAMGRVVFEGVNMQLAWHHVYQYQNPGSFLVDWEFRSCKFQSSVYDSRYIAAANAMLDDKSYCGYNYRHIRLGDGSVGGGVQTFTSVGSVYEYSQHEGVFVVAVGADIDNANFYGCYFEGNGSSGGEGDVVLQINTANHIRLANFDGCSFNSNTPQTVHIVQAGNGIGAIKVMGAVVNGTAILSQNTAIVYVDPFNVYRGGNAAQPNWKKAQYL